MKKKILAIGLVVCMLVVAIGSATMAYFTDTESATNVFTVGDVDIKIDEEFEQGETLLPGLDVEKEVKIENTGSNDAYVRVHIAVPTGIIDPHWNDDMTQWTSAAEDITYDIQIDGQPYTVYVYDYVDELPSGESTSVVLSKVEMPTDVDCTTHPDGTITYTDSEGNSITVSEQGLVPVLVAVEAGQTEGFEDGIDTSTEALDLMFGKAGTYDPWNGTSTISGWDGSVDPNFVDNCVDKDAKTITVSDAYQLAAWAAVANNYRGYTVEIISDIDLSGANWAPVNLWSPEGKGVTINGNGYTISGMTVDAGSYAGFIGNYAGGNPVINDLTFDGAYVTTSGSQAAVVLGRHYGHATLNNVTVTNSSVESTASAGINIAVLVGLSNQNEGAKLDVVNCTVTDNTISGYHTVGTVVGKTTLADSSSNFSINGTTITGNTVYYTATGGVGGHEVGAGDSGYAKVNFAGDNNTIEENVIIKKAVVSSQEDLKAAIGNGAKEIVLGEGEFTLPTLANTSGLTIEGAADGSTVVGGENTTEGFRGNFGNNTTVKNITFSGTTNGVRYSYAQGGTSTFENCTFAGDSTYGFHIDSSNGATFIFNDCTFVGFNAFAGDLESVTFNNCTFLSNGNYGHTNIWSKGYFNNCTWGDNTSVGQGKDSGAKLYFNGVEESAHHEFIGSAESLADFAKSVNEGNDSWKGQYVLLVDDIDLNNAVWTPIGQTGATEFKGIFDGQNYTISNLNVDSSDKTNEHYSSGLFGWAEAGVTIKNVKIDGAKVVGNHNVAAVVGYTYSAKISNCHVANAEITCNHANDDACGDKAGLIGGYVGDEARITDCSGSNSTVTAGRDAGQLIGAGYNASVSGCSATNVTVSATGECTGANINDAIIGRVLG